MRYFLLSVALVSFLAGYVQAQNVVESPLDRPTPTCYDNQCVCPDNYSIRENGSTSSLGRVSDTCEFNGLRQESKRFYQADSRSNLDASRSSMSVDPIDPGQDGFVTSGALAD